jgi:RES domain-containing protein
VPKGLRAVYTAATLSLAALELFVHTDTDLVPAHLRAIAADIPDDVSRDETRLTDLPANWRELPAPESLHEIGRSWIADANAAILVVPSVIIPGERNYIINPADPEFRRIHVTRPEAFTFDPRMWKSTDPLQ